MRPSLGCRLVSLCLLVTGVTRIAEAFLSTSGTSTSLCRTRTAPSSVAVQQQRYCRSQLSIISGPISVARRCAICHASKKDNESSSSNNSDHVPELSQSQPIKRSLRRRLRRWAVSLAFVTSALRYANRPAHAKFSYELQETPTHSLRPGMSKQQADDLQQGKIQVSDVEASSIFQKEKQKQETPSSKTKTAKQSKQQKKSASTFGYGQEEGEEDDDYFDEDDEDDFAAFGPSSAAAVRQTDQAIAERLQSQTTRQFAAKHQGKSTALYVKVGIAFFVPTYGTLIVREYVRRRREEAYVQKGLEILEAQKAEYFNVTNTTPDSDVQDELKGLKKNETKTDDDDDDDDDEDDDDSDDDDEPPPPRGGKPRRPRGDGPKTGGGSGGDGNDPGYGKPSDEDLDKLNRMFGRS